MGGSIALLFFMLVLIVVGAAFYFLPAIIAFSREKQNKVAILLLNIFLGWSLIGWVIALVWAFSQDPAPQQVVIQNNPSSTTESSDKQP